MAAPYRYSAKTHVGHVREINEDSVLALPERGLWIVSDGMGGHAAGEVASQIVTDYAAALPEAGSPHEAMTALREAMRSAHRAVLKEAEARGGITMGATVVALMLAEGHFVCFWVGDSRLYRLREGRLEMLTHDHSFVGEMVARGEITWDAAEAHPQANAITRALGVGEALELDKVRGALAPGDRFILCSDGLNKHVRDSEIEDHARTDPTETVASELVAEALARGGTDNVSVIVVDVV